MKNLKILFAILFTIAFAVGYTQVMQLPDVVAFANSIHLSSLGVGNDMIFASPALMTMFSKQVEKRPKPNNAFLQFAMDESENINGTNVVSPVIGDDPTGGTDPDKFPLELEQNDDDSNSWPISLHYTNPQRISDNQQLMVNYDQRQQIIDNHMAFIDRMIARHMLYTWSPTMSSRIIPATGATVAATLTKWGATGDRKVAGKDDILEAIQSLSEDDMDDELVGVVPAGFYFNLLKIKDFIDYSSTGRIDLLAKGFIGEIAGCKIMRRSTGVIYAADGVTPLKVKERRTVEKPRGFTVAEDALSGILIWNKSAVTKAIGKIEPYVDPKAGNLLGSSVNFSQRAGGKKRKDQSGIVVIREALV